MISFSWQIKIKLSSFLFDKCLTLQVISWTDFVQNIPEIYLTLGSFYWHL